MAAHTETLSQGIRALIEGRLHDAVAALSAALEEQPLHPVIHFDLAVAYKLLGDLRRALGHARLACEITGRAHAHVLYGHCARLARDLDLAERQLVRALEVGGAQRAASMHLGLLRWERGDRQEAERLLQEAIADGPDPLPVLVEQRILGQLFDLQRSEGGTPEILWCSAATMTEIWLEDEQIVTLSPPMAPRASRLPPRPHRVCTVEEVSDRLARAGRIVALTGAGISRASGLLTRKELWQRYDRDLAVSSAGLFEDPRVLWRSLRAMLGDRRASPSAAHQALARMEGLSAILTQNVDGLHTLARPAGDTRPILELHGSLDRTRCSRCGRAAASAYVLAEKEELPACGACGGALRPDVVLFGEQIRAEVLSAAVEEVTRCDVLLVVGCAMDVAPCSELPRLAALAGATVIELKRSPSRVSDAVGSWLLAGDCDRTLAEIDAISHPSLPALPSSPVAREPLGEEPLRLPLMGEGVAEVAVSRWLKRPGDHVSPGEIVAECETDKVCVDIDAPIGGILRSISANEGDTIPVRSILAYIDPEPTPKRTALQESGHPLFFLAGPRARSMRELLSSVEQANLTADDTIEREIVARVQAHTAALGLPALSIEIVRGLPAAIVLSKERWDKTEALDPGTLAWSEAYATAALRLRPPQGIPLYPWLGGRIRRRMELAQGCALAPIGSYVTSSLQDLAWGALGGRWRLEPGQLEPFGPLLALALSGALPFALPGGVIGICLRSPGERFDVQRPPRAGPPQRVRLYGLLWAAP